MIIGRQVVKTRLKHEKKYSNKLTDFQQRGIILILTNKVFSIKYGIPNGIRTRVPTMRGWCPRPLDDGDIRHHDYKSKPMQLQGLFIMNK